MLKESQGAKKEWDHYRQRIHVILNIFRSLMSPYFFIDINLDDIVYNDKATNDHGLTNFDTVNSCIDIDSISAENRDISHVNMVKDSKINVHPKDIPKQLGHDD